MATPDFALDHYAAQADLAAAAAQALAGMWAAVNPGDITGSWLTQIPEATAVLSGAQLAAARQAEPYLEEASLFADAVEDVAEKVAPKAFAGIASDGRALASLLYQPAITSLLAIKSGHDVRTALASGRATLDMITRTQVADAGRAAVQVGLTPRKELDGYIRVAVGKSCSRCIILAGKFYRYNSGFDRHPSCDCVHLPCKKAQAAGIDQDPQVIYNSLTPKERSQAGWSYADQKAIAEGADLGQVTNIHRKGALYVADGKQYTREGAKTRARQGIKEPRKTPGQIYREAGDDRDRAIALLRQHGYLYGPAKTAPPPAVDLQRKAVARQATIDTARARAQLLAELEEAAVINEANGPELARMAAAAAKRFGVVDDPELAKLLQRAASGDAAMVEATIESLGGKLGLTRIGGDLQTTQIVRYDKSLHDMLPGEKPSQWVEIVRPGYRLDLDGEQLILAKAVVAESDLKPMAVAAARAPVRAGQKALDSVPFSMTREADVQSLARDEHSFIRQYRGTASDGINGTLRRNEGKIPDSWTQEFLRDATSAIDAVMARSALTADIRVFRGIEDGEKVFGPAWARSLKGAEWTEHGYMSTSADEDIAKVFGGKRLGGALLKIRVPRGTHALQLSDPTYEAEVLVARGRRVRVVKDSGPGPNRVIEVEIAPAETTVVPLDKMTVPQLRDLAKQRGVKVASGARKADIVALLNNAPAAAVEDLSKKTVAELRQLAKDRGVKILAKDRKADLIAKLEGGTPEAKADTKAAVAHLHKLVEEGLPQRVQASVNEAFTVQGALAPKTSMLLRQVHAPQRGEDAKLFLNEGTFAYYSKIDKRLAINPGWAEDDIRGLGAEDFKVLSATVGQCRSSGWLTHSGAGDELGHICSHEFGHHVANAFMKNNGIPGKAFEEHLEAATAQRLLPAVSRALGMTTPPKGSAGKVGVVDLDKWIERNHATIESKVSEYAATNFNEMLAEVWQEYSTMGAQARPGIREIGQIMRELAEEMA